jgi:hypothetical protein
MTIMPRLRKKEKGTKKNGREGGRKEGREGGRKEGREEGKSKQANSYTSIRKR